MFYRPGLSVISYPVWHFGKYFYGQNLCDTASSAICQQMRYDFQPPLFWRCFDKSGLCPVFEWTRQQLKHKPPPSNRLPRKPIQGRVKTGLMEIITAPADGRVRLTDLRIGDQIAKDQKLAEQDSSALQNKHRLLQLQIKETETRIGQLASDIEFEDQLREVAREKLDLLAVKLKELKNCAAVRPFPRKPMIPPNLPIWQPESSFWCGTAPMPS